MFSEDEIWVFGEQGGIQGSTRGIQWDPMGTWGVGGGGTQTD